MCLQILKRFIKTTRTRHRKKMMRLFVGLELPSDIRDDLGAMCAGLKEVRWVEPHNMHITLAFIGEVEEGAAEELHHSLRHLSFEPFTLSLAEVDCFESRGKPKIVWAGVKGEIDALTHLHQKILGAVEMAGLEPERRKYKPHVTLARLRHDSPRERVFSYMESHNGLKTESFQVGSFCLYRSHLTRNGADYEVLERYP